MTRLLYSDPALFRHAPSPYATLARFGIVPESTVTSVLNSSFEWTPEDATDPQINEAWQTLRLTPERLVVDFFCLNLEPAAARDGATSDEGLRLIPWELVRGLSASLPPLEPWSSSAIPAAELPPTVDGALRLPEVNE